AEQPVGVEPCSPPVRPEVGPNPSWLVRNRLDRLLSTDPAEPAEPPAPGWAPVAPARLAAAATENDRPFAPACEEGAVLDAGVTSTGVDEPATDGQPRKPTTALASTNS